MFQTLSSELDALGAELTCQRSKFSGLSCVQQCLDDAFRVLSVIRASLTYREKQLSDLRQGDIQQVRTRLPWTRAEWLPVDGLLINKYGDVTKDGALIDPSQVSSGDLCTSSIRQVSQLQVGRLHISTQKQTSGTFTALLRLF